MPLVQEKWEVIVNKEVKTICAFAIITAIIMVMTTSYRYVRSYRIKKQIPAVEKPIPEQEVKEEPKPEPKPLIQTVETTEPTEESRSHEIGRQVGKQGKEFVRGLVKGLKE